ncbi:MAG: ATPase, T2SS/T4P/T4SS family [Thermodesulfovibrionales bacterium]|nr:ATPase, T2SS/T4P/T4SS family [Thermodesulfovibrionales bacterium]
MAASKDLEKLGEYFLRKNRITEDQLNHALSLAKEKKTKIGEVLVELGYITKQELMNVLLERLNPNELGKKRKIGEILLNSGIVTEDQLQHALQVQFEQKKRIGEILVDLGYVSKEEVTKALAKKLNLDIVLCSDYVIDEDLKNLIPKEILKKYTIFPLAKKDGALLLAMADPLNINAINEIAFRTRLKIIPVMSYDWSIEMAIEDNYGYDTDVHESHEEIMFTTLESELIEEKEIKFKELEEHHMGGLDVETLYLQSNAPKIVKLVAMLITDATKKRASDIHIEPRSKYVQIRFRIDGELQDIFKYQKELHDSVVSRIKIISKLDITNRRTSQDGGATVVMKGRTIDLRISTLPIIYGEKVVIRLLDQGRGLVPLDKLAMPVDIEKAIIQMFKKPQGMFIVTGPTGSGKTTTLYACLNHLRSNTRNVITIENPVEYKLEGISQTAVDEAVGRTFASILRSVLRQDPDIIMVGEIRDLETAEIAIKAALTGHLVLTTLHTNNTVASITRLVDIGIPPYLVASSVSGILSQRLVRKICPHCKVETEVSEDIKTSLAGFGIEHIEKFYKGAGCNKCFNTGYLERTAVYEYLSMTRNLKMALSKTSDEQYLLSVARKDGLKYIYEDALDKVSKGITTIEEVLSKVPFDFTLKEI